MLRFCNMRENIKHWFPAPCHDLSALNGFCLETSEAQKLHAILLVAFQTRQSKRKAYLQTATEQFEDSSCLMFRKVLVPAAMSWFKMSWWPVNIGFDRFAFFCILNYKTNSDFCFYVHFSSLFNACKKPKLSSVLLHRTWRRASSVLIISFGSAVSK